MSISYQNQIHRLHVFVATVYNTVQCVCRHNRFCFKCKAKELLEDEPVGYSPKPPVEVLNPPMPRYL